MASPFSIFRKHQRAMMAVLGILCMFAFTFTGFVGGLGSGLRESQDPVAVTTSVGDYHENDLRDMRYQRSLAKTFVLQVIVQSFEPQLQRFIERSVAEFLEQVIGPPTDSSLVESRLLAREAKEQGVVIADDSVTDAVEDIAREIYGMFQMPPKELTGQDFQVALRNLSREGRPINKLMVYNALRTELLARQMRMVFFSSLQSTPAQRWDYYQRLKRRVRVELAAVPASEFVDGIANPPEDVARKFYEEYKDREPEPGSPEPGFKIPHRAAFRFFEVHYQDFYHPEEVSEAEIKAYYEKNKDTQYLYNEFQTPADELEEPAPENKPAEKAPEKPAEKKPSENKPAEKPAENKPAEAPSAQQGKAPADGNGPEAKTPKEDKQGKADENEQQSDASDSNCGGAPEPNDDSDRTDNSKPESNAAAGAPKAGEKPAAAADSTSEPPPAPDADDKAAAAPGGNAAAPTGVPAAPGGQPPAAKPEVKQSTAPPLSDRFALPTDITKGPNPKYEPLWSAESKIRKQLAGDKAVEQMEKAVLALKGKLRPYLEASSAWETRKGQEPKTPQPTPPDLQALAKGLRGVTVGDIPLEPDYEVARVPGIGSSRVSGQPFVAFAVTGLKLFHAVESQDNDGNRYLFWKTDDQEARVPPLSEIRDEVVQVWKRREARRPMMARAEELADKARKSQKSLKDALADVKGVQVTETPAFSWLTEGIGGQMGRRQMPRLSEVPGTDDIGDEFMRAVYDLQVGDVGVAENHPQTVAYVVRMTTSEPPQPVLRDMFLADRFETYSAVATEAHRPLYQEWLRNQLAAFKVHWVRPPYDETRSE